MGGGRSSGVENPGTGQDNRIENAPERTASTSEVSSSAQPSSSPGNSSSFITDRGANEIMTQTSNTQNTTLSDFTNDTPSPHEFSTQVFHSGARSRRITAGVDGRQAVPIHHDDRFIGTWEKYDVDDITDSSPLGNEVDVTGRGEDQMEVYTLDPSDNRAADKAFVTNIDADWGHPHEPDIYSAHSQMVMATALDTMGVAAPRHTIDTQNKEVISESVPKPGYDAQVARRDKLSAEYANRVDGKQLRDVMAANLIGGNVDLKGENIMIGEDGRAVPFDLDWTEKMHNPDEFVTEYGSWSQNAIEEINAVRNEPLDIEPEDVVDRARDIATHLHETGMYKDVHDSVSQVDDFFQQLPVEQFGGQPGDEVQPHAPRLRTHMLGWSRDEVTKQDMEAIDPKFAQLM